MRFLYPELLALTLLAPAAGWLAARVWRRRTAASEAWAARGLWDRLLAGWSPRRLVLSVALLTTALLGTTLALAQPRWGVAEQTTAREGVDVVYLLDSSLSMGAQDVQPSRLAAAKTLVRRLIRGMPANRAGLVGAEGEGLVLAPLTTDAAVVDLVLEGLVPGSLPTPGTDLGDALRLLSALYPPGSERHRAAVVLSDGEDHGDGLAPRLEALSEAGVVVHAIGVGTGEGAPVPLPGRPGAEGAVKHRSDGSVVISALHEEVLGEIARSTGGIYLRAHDGGRDLRPIMAAIASMESQSLEARTVETDAERFQWPLAASAAALVLYLAVPPFRGRPGGGSPPGGGRR